MVARVQHLDRALVSLGDRLGQGFIGNFRWSCGVEFRCSLGLRASDLHVRLPYGVANHSLTIGRLGPVEGVSY
jgi:hypothetical protein